jgi:hypothetical protein
VTNDRTVWITLPVQVEFNYQPAEPADTGPEAMYPGCAESVEIEGLYIGRAEITAEIGDDLAAEIETELWNVINEERNAA